MNLTQRISQQVTEYRKTFPPELGVDLLAIIDHEQERIYVGPRDVMLRQAPSLNKAFDILAMPAIDAQPNTVDAVWVCDFDGGDWARCFRLRLAVGNAPGGEA